MSGRAVRRPAILDRMVDWQLAAKVAEGVAALQPSGDPAPFQALVRPADESERLVVRLHRPDAGRRCAAGGRGGRPAAWIDANLDAMRGVLDPAAAKAAERMGALGGVVGGAAGAVLALEAGAISGFLAGRVLGQYEFPVLDPAAPARLLFVAPNLGHAAGTLDAEPDELLRWVALHEITHALQFGGVPWLREHLAGPGPRAGRRARRRPGRAARRPARPRRPPRARRRRPRRRPRGRRRSAPSGAS